MRAFVSLLFIFVAALPLISFRAMCESVRGNAALIILAYT